MASPFRPTRTFEFWLGRAGSGKTYACIEAIAEELSQRPRGAPLLFLVPEQATATMEQALVTRPGLTGFTRARVISFRSLTNEIFRRAGGRPRAVIDEPSRVLLLRQAIRRRAGELEILRPVASLPGLAEGVGKTLLEFQRYGWRREDLGGRIAALAEAGRAMSPLALKLRDLSRLWEEFERLLVEKGLGDAPGLTDAAERQLAGWDELSGARLWIDGFASFTVQEFRLLEALFERVDSAVLALCLDPGRIETDPKSLIGPQRIFENLRETYSSIRERVESLGWATKSVSFPRADQPIRFSGSPALAHLESRVLAELHPVTYPAADWATDCANSERGVVSPIEWIECPNPRGEIESVAKRVAQWCDRTRTGSLRWSQVAVLARDLAPYEGFIREIFPRYGIPFFLDAPRSISGHPLARLLLSAFALLEENWPRERALDYLKTGLTPLKDRDAIARIENLATRRKLSGTAWFNADAWRSPHRGGGEAGREAEERAIGESFEQWSRAIQPLLAMRSALSAAGVDPARAIWKFLEDVGAPVEVQSWIEEAKSDGSQEVAHLHFDALRETAELLDRFHRIGVGRGTAESRADLGDLREAIETGFANARARLIPPTLDQVLVGSVERSRTPEIEAAFVLGLADGAFPRAYEEDPMFGDEERRALRSSGARLGPDSAERYAHERYLAYIALTRPSRNLVATRPVADSRGRPQGPSSFFRAVSESFPEAGTSSANGNSRLLPEEWVGNTLAAFHDAVAGEDPSPLGNALLGPHPLGLVDLDEPGNEPARERIRAAIRALGWPRDAHLTPELAREFWLPDPNLRITSLEDFAACPFRFFASRMLRLERPQDPLPGPLELGQLRHHLLDQLFLRLGGGKPLHWGSIDIRQASSLIDEILPEATESHLADSFGRDGLSRAVAGAIAAEVKEFLKALKAMGERYRFLQVDAEHRFGSGEEALFVVEIDPGLRFRLRGSVDRVDRLDGDPQGEPRLLIYDYKSAGKRLDITRLFHGVDLQLPAYALALEKEFARGGSHQRARVAGFFYWPLSIGLEKAQGEEWSHVGSAEWFAGHRPAGLFEENIAHDLDSTVRPGASALAFNFGVNKDGALDKRKQSALPSELFRALLAHVERTLDAHARRIASGEIAIEPLIEGAKKSCDFCDFASVCRIQSIEPAVFRRLAKIDFRKLAEHFPVERTTG